MIISFLAKFNFMKSKLLFLILCLSLLITIVSAQSVISTEYGDGWMKECYDDNTCAVSNYHTIMRWDGQYIDYDKLNFNNGDWTYKVDINTDNITLTRLDDKLVLPNNANYTFALNKVNMEFTVTPAQLNTRSIPYGANWYIEIPEAYTKTHFIWDNNKPTVTNNIGSTLNETEYWYVRYNNKYYLAYNSVARTWGASSSTITFTFNSWTIGDTGSSWSGNSSYNNFMLDRNTNHIILPDAVTDGLILYHKMSGSSGITSYDMNTTSNNNGALTNMNLGIDNCTGKCGGWTSLGKFGNGMNFDGVNDYVDAGSNGSLNFGSNNFTASVWFNAKTLNSNGDIGQDILGKYLTDGYGWFIGTSKTSKLGLYIRNLSEGWIYSVGIARTSVTLSTWHHAVAVKGGTNIKFYYDGVLIETASTDTVRNIPIQNPMRIGIIRDYFNGTIDEVRIYNRALTNDEINQTMNNTMYTSGNISTSYNFGSNYRGAQVKSIYINDTNSFLDLYASSDNTTWYLVQDNASNNTYYNIPSSIKNQTQYVRAVLKGNATSTPEVYSLTILGELQAITLNYVSPTLPDNTYTNVNYTQVNISFSNTFGDASLNTFIFNWNGTNTSYSNTSGSITNCSTTLKCFYTNVTNLVDGNYTYYGWLNDTFGNSNMSTIRSVIIDTVLPTIDFIPPTDANNTIVSRNYTFINTSVSDANNITALINFNRSLVGWWRFNEGTGTEAQDFSSYGNNGTLTNMNLGIDNCTGNCSGWTTSGKFGNALKFDGVNDYVNAGSGASLNITNAITVEAWINPKYKAGDWHYNQGIVSKYSAGFDGPIFLELNSNATSIGSYDSLSFLSYSYDFTNKWSHVAVTSNGINRILYINGVAVINGSTIPLRKTPDNLFIGFTNNYYRYFNGTIDEVRIYNRALSPEEINASYNAGLYRLYNNFTNLSDGTYNYTAYVQDAAGNVNSTNKQYVTIDITPPLSITNLTNTTSNFYHNWTWNNPTIDFNYTIIYINNTYVTSTSNNYYNLSANAHNISTISTHTVDIAGNINSTWVNNTSTIPNNIPVLSSISDKSIDENQWLNFSITGIDVDNDTLTCGTNATKGSLTGCNFSWSTAVGDASTYHINFNITDGYGGSANQTITITVSSITTGGGGGGGGKTTGGSFISYTPSGTPVLVQGSTSITAPASIISPPPAPRGQEPLYSNPIIKIFLIILVISGVFVISEASHNTKIEEDDKKYRIGNRVKTSNTRRSSTRPPDKK